MIFGGQTFGGWLVIVQAHLRRRGLDKMADRADEETWGTYWRDGYNAGAAVREELSYDDRNVP